MRKLSTILALVLVVALCASFTAFAEEVPATDTVKGIGSVSKDVELTYDSLAEDRDTIVYSADVVWSDVSFSYDAGTTKWNPEKHDYSASGASASWTDAEGSVKVTNHSNADIDVIVSFVAATTANGTATINVTNGEFTLTSGADVDYDNAYSAIATLAADGQPTSNATIGAVTVQISAAN